MTTRVGMLCFILVNTAWAQSWCKGKSGKVGSAGSWEDAVKQDDPTDSVPAIVACLCDHECGSSSNDFEVHGADVEKSRQSWSKRLEMSDDDWADAAAWATEMASARQGHELRNDDEKIAWSTLDPIGQYMLLNWNIGIHYDANYMADAFGANLSAAGKLAYIHHCLGRNEGVVQWAMCQPDIDAFDPKKIAAEIHADTKHNGFQKFMVRLSMDRAREALAKHAKEVKAESDKDPAYAKMFTIAADTRKQWEAMWKSDAALLELTLAMDDARITNSRRAFAGCDARTWPAFKAAVSTVPAKQFAAIDTNVETWKEQPRIAAMQLVTATPKGYLAGVAHYICHSGDAKKDPLIRALGNVLMSWPGFRGPRNAAQIAIASAGLELDDRSAKIDFPGVHRQYFSESGDSHGGTGGVIKSLKPQGDKTHIEFTTVKVKEMRCTSYKYTHRLTGIDSNGRFTYESFCNKETTVMVDSTARPADVQKRYAEGLKPGMKIMVTEDAVDLAWTAGKPAFVAAAPVK
jgi:hypothetical protein